MRRHPFVIAGLLVVALVVVFVALTLRLFVYPATNAPAHVGAIVVLGGVPDGEQRGVALARAGDAHILAVSQADEPCPGAITGVRIICFTPRPFTTQGEARFMGGLARDDRLHSMIVVSLTPQATVARVRFERCFSGRILIVPVEPASRRNWIDLLFKEWGSLGKALVLQRSC